MGDRLGFENRVGLDVTDKYYSPVALGGEPAGVAHNDYGPFILGQYTERV